ncbi:MAG TPA: hypothetical protein VJJ22_00010 [Candidatus Paceibacterota bacterium]
MGVETNTTGEQKRYNPDTVAEADRKIREGSTSQEEIRTAVKWRDGLPRGSEIKNRAMPLFGAKLVEYKKEILGNN